MPLFDLGIAAHRLRRRFYGIEMAVSLLTLNFLLACSSPPAPLSVDMHNAKLNQSLTCKAQDPLGMTDRAVLAAAVEACVKQLESRGFVQKN